MKPHGLYVGLGTDVYRTGEANRIRSYAGSMDRRHVFGLLAGWVGVCKVRIATAASHG